MSYFNINIDNDITYLLEEIGHNVLVNNEDATAIINNSDSEHDDKEIITNSELKRGYYINYNDLNFILLNEVNDKRYKSYYKGIMRNCNFDVKFIIQDKLYLFYSFIESDKFALNSSQMITLSADTITVTLPSTEITKKLAINMRFVSMGRAWEINGIDKTKLGLISLICKISLTDPLNDDVENEIANRYISGLDRLKGNITPILPFAEGVEPEEPEEPEEPPVEELAITGLDKFTVYEKNFEYSINTDKPVTWTLSRTDVLKFMSKVDNKCVISPVSTSKIGKTRLRATLVEDETIFVEKEISIAYC